MKPMWLAPQLRKLFGVKPVGGHAGDADRAGGRRQDAAEDRQQRRLAAARRAHQQRQLAGDKCQAGSP